tara:strand:+ start:86 stop:520 length:435 start_codon:yes stop_codon:yes gene_type:complete
MDKNKSTKTQKDSFRDCDKRYCTTQVLNPLIHYTEDNPRSVFEFKNIEGENCGYGYDGTNIKYSNESNRVTFVDSFGDCLDKEGLLGECAGHLTVEIWGKMFTLEIETASGHIVEMTRMDTRMLKKLNNFLTYALNNNPKGKDF